MEGFYPDGRIKYKRAIDYGKPQTQIDSEVMKKVLWYMRNSKHRRVLLRVLDRSGTSIEYDGVFWWQEKTFKQLEDGECYFIREFVDHVLRRLKEDGEG